MSLLMQTIKVISPVDQEITSGSIKRLDNLTKPRGTKFNEIATFSETGVSGALDA